MNIETMEYTVPARVENGDFHAARAKGIGGSDAGAILGLNPWKSKYDVYLEKIGDREDYDNEKMYWGRELEERIVKEFELRSDYVTEAMNEQLVHSKYPWMIANVDREIPGVGILEVKTTSAFAKATWDESGVPESYQAQCQHYMAVTGHDKTFLAVLFGGQEFITYKIFRDDEFIENLIQVEKDFLENNVMPQKSPDMDGSDASSETLKKLYPESTDQSMDLPPVAMELIDQYNSAKADADKYATKQKEAENKIKELLGENERGIVEDWVISWKSTKPRETFDAKTFKKDEPDLHAHYVKTGASSRRFSVKPIV